MVKQWCQGVDMLDYIENSSTDKSKGFTYYVEGDRTNSGRVLLDLISGECVVDVLADNDRHSRYANHLADALERYFINGSLKPSGTLMWY